MERLYKQNVFLYDFINFLIYACNDSVKPRITPAMFGGVNIDFGFIAYISDDDHIVFSHNLYGEIADTDTNGFIEKFKILREAYYGSYE